MPTVATLRAVATADVGDADRKLATLDRRISATATTAQSSGGRIRGFFSEIGRGGASLQSATGAALGFVGAQAAIGAANQGVRAIKAIVNGGADLVETMNKVKVTFGASSRTVTREADRMASRFGYVRQTFLDAASGIGLIAKGAGLVQPAAARMGREFASLAADVSSFYNVPVADALVAIRAGLVGEAEPLRRYGVLVNEAAVQQEALRLGVARSGEKLNDQQKVIARASLITKGFADAQGDLARTQDSVANRFREIQGRITNAATDLGTKALPAIEALINGGFRAAGALGRLGGTVARELAPGFRDLIDAGGNVVGIFDDLWEAVEPAARILGGLSLAVAVAGFRSVAGSARLLSEVLGPLAGLLADHKELVTAVALAYTVSLVPSVARAVVGFADLQRVRIGIWLLELRDRAREAGGSMGMLRSALAVVPRVVAWVAIGNLATNLADKLGDAGGRVRALHDELERDFDLSSLQGLDKALNDVAARQQAAEERLDRSYRGLGGAVRGVVEVLTPLRDGFVDSLNASRDAGEEAERLSARQLSLHNVIARLAREGQTSARQIEVLARRLGVDLVNNTEEAEAAIREHLVGLQGATPATEQLSAATDVLGDETATATEKVNGLKEALDALVGIHVDALAAEIRYRDSIADLSRVLGENGGTLDVNTEAGRKNLDAVLKVVDATTSHVSALQRQGGQMDALKGTFGGHVEDLRRVLTEVTGNKREVDTLLGALGLLDTAKAFPEIKVVGAETAHAQITGLEQHLAQMGANVNQAFLRLILGPGVGAGTSRGPRGTRATSRTIPQLVTGEAAGGLLRQSGSENHIAQVVPANTIRVWSEPETGGEAYIPLARHKRRRSTRVLEQVASEFGYGLAPMAEGGLLRRASRAAGAAHRGLGRAAGRIERTVGRTVGRAVGPAARVVAESVTPAGVAARVWSGLDRSHAARRRDPSGEWSNERGEPVRPANRNPATGETRGFEVFHRGRWLPSTEDGWPLRRRMAEGGLLHFAWGGITTARRPAETETNTWPSPFGPVRESRAGYEVHRGGRWEPSTAEGTPLAVRTQEILAQEAGRRAEAVRRHPRLAALGADLRVEDFGPYASLMLRELATVPESILARAAGWTEGIWVGSRSAAEMSLGTTTPINPDDPNPVGPPGYRWRNVGGFVTGRNVFAGGAPSGSVSTALHELGHAVDEAYGRLSATPGFAGLRPQLRGLEDWAPNEAFAEAFARWIHPMAEAEAVGRVLGWGSGLGGGGRGAAGPGRATAAPNVPGDVSTWTDLRRGSRGDRVVALQRALVAGGIDPGPVDGVFGPRTEAAAGLLAGRFAEDDNRHRWDQRVVRMGYSAAGWRPVAFYQWGGISGVRRRYEAPRRRPRPRPRRRPTLAQTITRAARADVRRDISVPEQPGPRATQGQRDAWLDAVVRRRQEVDAARRARQGDGRSLIEQATGFARDVAVGGVRAPIETARAVGTDLYRQVEGVARDVTPLAERDDLRRRPGEGLVDYLRRVSPTAGMAESAIRAPVESAGHVAEQVGAALPGGRPAGDTYYGRAVQESGVLPAVVGDLLAVAGAVGGARQATARVRGVPGRAAQALATDEGFSMRPFTGEAPGEAGFMVSQLGAERVIPGLATPAQIAAFRRRNMLGLARPGRFLGGWVEGGQTYLDISRRHGVLEDALEAGRREAQLAVFDMGGPHGESARFIAPFGEGPGAEAAVAQAREARYRMAQQTLRRRALRTLSERMDILGREAGTIVPGELARPLSSLFGPAPSGRHGVRPRTRQELATALHHWSGGAQGDISENLLDILGMPSVRGYGPEQVQQYPYWTRAARRLVNAAERSPETGYRLYRGMRLTPEQVEAFTGESFELALAGFSPARGVAHEFARPFGPNDRGASRALMLDIEPGARALNLRSVLGARYSYGDEAEHLLSGRFEVLDVARAQRESPPSTFPSGVTIPGYPYQETTVRARWVGILQRRREQMAEAVRRRQAALGGERGAVVPNEFLPFRRVEEAPGEIGRLESRPLDELRFATQDRLNVAMEAWAGGAQDEVRRDLLHSLGIDITGAPRPERAEQLARLARDARAEGTPLGSVFQRARMGRMLLNAAERAAPVDEALWRGMKLDWPAYQRFVGGRSFEIPLAGFTPIEEIARDFARPTVGQIAAEQRSLTLQLEPGTPALSLPEIGNYGAYAYGFPEEAEHLVSGRFDVLDVERHPARFGRQRGVEYEATTVRARWAGMITRRREAMVDAMRRRQALLGAERGAVVPGELGPRRERRRPTTAGMAARWPALDLDDPAVFTQAVQNVRDLYALTPETVREAGRRWYPAVHEAVRKGVRGTGLSEWQGAGIVAAVSPQMDWQSRNIHALREITEIPEEGWARIIGGAAAGRRSPEVAEMLRGTSLAHAGDAELLKAYRIMAGEDPGLVLSRRTAPKTHSFARNIYRPEEAGPVTVDYRAADIARNQLLPTVFTGRGLTGRRYAGHEDVYRVGAEEIGAEFGEPLLPHALQAVTWEGGKYTERLGGQRGVGVARHGQPYVERQGPEIRLPFEAQGARARRLRAASMAKRRRQLGGPAVAMARGGINRFTVPIHARIESQVRQGAPPGPGIVAPRSPGAGEPGMGGTGREIGTSWQSIVAYLNRRQVPHRATSTTGGRHVPGSYHYRGKAVDLVGPDKLRIARTLDTQASSLAELFFTPLGHSVKNARRVVPPIAAAGHYSHVHAATFADGGMIGPNHTMGAGPALDTATLIRALERLGAQQGRRSSSSSTTWQVQGNTFQVADLMSLVGQMNAAARASAVGNPVNH